MFQASLNRQLFHGQSVKRIWAARIIDNRCFLISAGDWCPIGKAQLEEKGLLVAAKWSALSRFAAFSGFKGGRRAQKRAHHQRTGAQSL
jgi:hypothetical protein